MRADLLEKAADLARGQKPFVLAVVVRRQPASSAQTGDMALVTAEGDFHGWLGGSCIQPTVVREAKRALADGRPRLVALAPEPELERRPGVAVFPMTCHSGGTVEIYLEPVLPSPRLVVFGASPTARAVVKVGKAMGYSVVAIDPAAEPAMFPEADRVLNSPEMLEPKASAFAVVSTMGEGDEEAIRSALALSPVYLGVVASKRRFAQMRQTLLAQGVTAGQLDTIHSPAGLDIGARTPEEIALSVLAQIVEERRAAESAATKSPETEPVARDAIDPICGMTVEIASARHTVEYEGRTWYFCCGGCRQKFLAEPERFAAEKGAA